jgi:MOSC domain-containing protein YiiM
VALIVSVNVGVPRATRFSAVGVTGIDKRPVDGPVALRPAGSRGTSGVAGDAICDSRHHGGDDQAVYVFAREELDAWEAELGQRLAGGSFGENLTTCGLDCDAALIGERWRVGSGGVLLEVTGPRIPCGTFAGWLGVQGWIKRFTERARSGAYLRVLVPGEVGAGDPVTVVERPDHGVSVQTVFRAVTLEPALLPRLAEVEALPADIRRRAALLARSDRTQAQAPGAEADAEAGAAPGAEAGAEAGDGGSVPAPRSAPRKAPSAMSTTVSRATPAGSASQPMHNASTIPR